MAIQFADRVRVNTATTGTGTMNLGSAIAGYRTFAQAVTDGALSSGCTIYYAIQDGNNWECGTGVYTAGTPDTLTRTVASSSSGGTTALSLSGSANVSLTLTALSTVNALLTGGTINNTAIGGTTPSTGAFTTLSAISALTAPTQAYNDSSTNVATTAFVQGITNGIVSITQATGTFTVSSTQAMEAFFQWSGATAGVTLLMPNVQNKFLVDNNNSFPITVTASGLTLSLTIAANSNESCYIDGINGVSQSSTDFTNVAITGGNINNTTIGGTTPVSGRFSVLTVTGGSTLTGTVSATTVSASTSFTGGTGSFTTVTAPVMSAATSVTGGTGTFTTLNAVTASVGASTTQVATTAWVMSRLNTYTTIALATNTATGTTSLIGIPTVGVTGALTANGELILPPTGEWTIFNGTTGNFTLKARTSSQTAGAGVIVPFGGRITVYADSANAVQYSQPVPQATATLTWEGGTVAVNGTYHFTASAPYSGMITFADYQSLTGSFTATVQIAGTTVTGISAVTATATAATATASALNTFTAGQAITLVVASATSSPTNAFVDIRIVRG